MSGTVAGLTGHLGDLDINPKDGRVHGSLGYKAEEAYQIAIVDGDTANTHDHRCGSSGIDGVAFGPAFGNYGTAGPVTRLRRSSAPR